MPSAIEAMGMKESISRMRSQEAQLSTADNPEDAKKYQDRTNEAIEQFKAPYCLLEIRRPAR